MSTLNQQTVLDHISAQWRHRQTLYKRHRVIPELITDESYRSHLNDFMWNDWGEQLRTLIILEVESSWWVLPGGLTHADTDGFTRRDRIQESELVRIAGILTQRPEHATDSLLFQLKALCIPAIDPQVNPGFLTIRTTD